MAQNRAQLWHLLLAVPNQGTAAGFFCFLLRFPLLQHAIYYIRFSTQALRHTKS